MTTTPPGWPGDLPLCADPEFLGQVCRWLLERLPGEFRGTATSKDPVALAWVLQQRVHSDLELMRTLYATARTRSGSATPDVLLESLSGVGAQLLRTAREVDSVVVGLAGLDHGNVNTSDLD